jgi:HAD superfamily hydrolase (TIGR01509 family)
MFSVIFDMDGTLLDTQRICIPAWDYAGEKQGFKNVGKHIPNVCGMNQNGWTNYLKTNFKDLDTVVFTQDARQYILDNLKVEYKKGAKELIAFLKKNNVKIGLASGSSRNSIEHHLNEINANDVFDVIVAGTEVANGKPAPDIFLLTAEKLGANPEDCFVFEDSENGIKAGFAAGMKCIGIPDVVDFSNDIKNIMFAYLQDLSQAIEILKNHLD